jgi:hypothetical protein
VRLLDGIERLITEHGSAAILRERVALAREQYAALETKVADLERDNETLRSSNAGLQAQVRQLEQTLADARSTAVSAVVCDHCGSSRLKRIGNRPDPMFGDVGVKQAVFSCADCGKESAFTQQP